MTALAHRGLAFEVRTDRSRNLTASQLRLRPTEDGWSLIGPRGEVVFRGLGVRARRECLEYARDHGVVAVFS
jgi:hypothetical protein